MSATLEIKAARPDDFFAVFSACAGADPVLVLDVRPAKDFARNHLLHAFCVRVSANGAALLDYSKAQYEHFKWSDACWWGRDVLIYGDEGLKKDHPVVAFLARDAHARSVRVYKDGFPALAAAFPFLCTSSVKTAAGKRYPSLLEPGLFLGDWEHAEARDRLAELSVRSVVTIHNNPERMAPPPGGRHLRIQLADVESEDIAPWLRQAHEFIEQSRQAGHAVLVHCGAGVSRSAALCVAHLMQRHRWGAQRALDHVVQRRAIVKPNDGFWHALCALEAELGLANRSDPEAFRGVHGLDYSAPAPEKAAATFIPAAAAAPAPEAAIAQAEQPPSEGDRRRRRSRSRSRSPRRQRHSSRSRERRRSRSRERRRSRSREKRRSRSRERRRSRSRGRRDRDKQNQSNGHRKEEAAAPAPAPDHPEPGPVLEILKDGQSLGRLLVQVSRPSQECIFGRLPSCGVPLDHLSISRHHAKLTTDGAGGFFITDLGSAHGTNLDGAWVRPQAARRLRRGSVLRFGASSREYRVASLPGEA